MEVRRVRHLDLSSTVVMEIKNLVGSYSDEQGFCSYFWIVERGPNYKFFFFEIPNYKFLNIDLFWKFLSVGRLSRCFHARRLSYTWTTFLYLNGPFGLGRHYEQTEDGSIFGSPSTIIETQISELGNVENFELWKLN